MCDSVQQKLVHTKGYISTNMVRRKDDVYFNEDYDPNFLKITKRTYNNGPVMQTNTNKIKFY